MAINDEHLKLLALTANIWADLFKCKKILSIIHTNIQYSPQNYEQIQSFSHQTLLHSKCKKINNFLYPLLNIPCILKRPLTACFLTEKC